MKAAGAKRCAPFFTRLEPNPTSYHARAELVTKGQSLKLAGNHNTPPQKLLFSVLPLTASAFNFRRDSSSLQFWRTFVNLHCGLDLGCTETPCQNGACELATYLLNPSLSQDISHHFLRLGFKATPAWHVVALASISASKALQALRTCLCDFHDKTCSPHWMIMPVRLSTWGQACVSIAPQSIIQARQRKLHDCE